MKNIFFAIVLFIAISSFYLVVQAGEIHQIPVMTQAFRKEEVSRIVVEVVEKENVFMVLLSVISTIIASVGGVLGIIDHFSKAKAGNTNKKTNKNRNTKPGGNTRFSLFYKYFFTQRVFYEEVFC